MGKYTAHNNPIVDQVVAEHLERIINAITAHLNPQSIILYGSFGRGEGSVILENDRLVFLSDYELAVVTRSPFYRSVFRELSHKLTKQLGVEVSISWMRPGRLYSNQPQNLSWGRARPTIGMYELRQGGTTLYGQQVLAVGPPIDPAKISLKAGIRLLINRMAEVLNHLPGATIKGLDRIEAIRRMSKVTLACGESLLLSWGAYHFSYAERGRRFTALAPRRMQTIELPAHYTEALVTLVQRATDFKLLPSLSLFPEDLDELWSQVIYAVDITFRYLMQSDLNISFDSFAEFPDQFLRHPQVRRTFNLYRIPLLPAPFDQKLVDAIKYLRQRRLPPKGFFTHPTVTANQIVFAVIPPLLMSLDVNPNDDTLSQTTQNIRRWLEVIGEFDKPSSDLKTEWDILRRRTIKAWYNFCVN
jgi:hypothetical protein